MSAHDSHYEQQAAYMQANRNKEIADHYEQILYTKDKTPTVIIVSKDSTVQQEHILQLLNKLD